MGNHLNRPEVKTPAPGDYNIPSKMSESPKKTFGTALVRGSIYKKTEGPGPGGYEADKFKSIGSSKSIGYS
jgi:hypothetical protein